MCSPTKVANVDAQTDELRNAHDALAEPYLEVLAGALDRMPSDRAVLNLFCDLVGPGGLVLDVGCGTGRLLPYLAARGLNPRGVDLSPGMVRVARRENPDFAFEIADVRALPLDNACLDGVVAWYSLMYLAPEQRQRAFSELARVVRSGGYLATAFKAADNGARRSGQSLVEGVAYDVYWHSPEEVQDRVREVGFESVFWAGRPADPDEAQPQGYLVSRRI